MALGGPAGPVRILRVMTRLNIGGPAIHATLLSTRLDSQRFRTWLVVGRPEASEGDLTGFVRSAHVDVVQLGTLRRPIRPWADAVSLVRLLRVAWRVRPQIIHTHMAKAGALGRLAALVYNGIGPGHQDGQRAVMVHTFHGHVLERYFSAGLSRIFLAIERWLAHRTDCLIAVSARIRDELLAKGIGTPTQWRVVPLGLDLVALADLPLSHGDHPVQCGLVGRLVPIKNPSLLLQALQRLIKQHAEPPMQMLMIGDGPLRASLEQEVHVRGLDGLVRFTGWQRDLCAVYNQLDITCLTSLNEGTPVSLIEAMAAGRAVVATDVGGVRDVLADQHDVAPIAPGTFRLTLRGILIRPGDADGLAAALGTLAAEGSLRNRLGQAARSHVMARYTTQRLVADISTLYNELQHRRQG